MYNEDHLPWTFVRRSPGTASMFTPVVLRYPSVRVHSEAYVCPTLVLGVSTVEEVHAVEVLYLFGVFRHEHFLAHSVSATDWLWKYCVGLKHSQVVSVRYWCIACQVQGYLSGYSSSGAQ